MNLNCVKIYLMCLILIMPSESEYSRSSPNNIDTCDEIESSSSDNANDRNYAGIHTISINYANLGNTGLHD